MNGLHMSLDCSDRRGDDVHALELCGLGELDEALRPIAGGEEGGAVSGGGSSGGGRRGLGGLARGCGRHIRFVENAGWGFLGEECCHACPPGTVVPIFREFPRFVRASPARVAFVPALPSPPQTPLCHLCLFLGILAVICTRSYASVCQLLHCLWPMLEWVYPCA